MTEYSVMINKSRILIQVFPVECNTGNESLEVN